MPSAVPLIHQCQSLHDPGWLSLRHALWPQATRQAHLLEMQAQLASPGRHVHFLALTPEGEAIGLAEASVRHDHVNGTTTSPVGFLEGLYVVPGHRQQGVARHLVAAVAGWATRHGCEELASDALLDNESSHAMHLALGFEETERVVYFRKPLPAAPISEPSAPKAD